MSMMQSITAQLDGDDLFAMTEGDIAKMRAIARMQVRAAVAPAQAAPVRDLESDLLVAMAEADKQSEAPLDSSTEPKSVRAERLQTHEIGNRLCAALGRPKTAADISRETGIPRSTVTAFLRKMALAGLAEAESQGHTKGGHPKPFLYASPGTFRKPIDFNERKASLKNPKLRAKVIAALSEPRAAFQVSDLLKISRGSAQYQIRQLAAAGLIRKHGSVEVWRTKGVDTWVRA
jgi:predicted transcriptional regulator